MVGDTYEAGGNEAAPPYEWRLTWAEVAAPKLRGLLGAELGNILPSLRPDGTYHAYSIASEDRANVGIAVSAADQTVGQIEGAFGMVRACYSDVIGFVDVIAVALEIRLRGRVETTTHGVPIADQIEIASDGEMLDAD
jgi:hypothetical protein